MAYRVYKGKTGKTKVSCHKDKAAAKRKVSSMQARGVKGARLRKVSSCAA